MDSKCEISIARGQSITSDIAPRSFVADNSGTRVEAENVGTTIRGIFRCSTIQRRSRSSLARQKSSVVHSIWSTTARVTSRCVPTTMVPTVSSCSLRCTRLCWRTLFVFALVIAALIERAVVQTWVSHTLEAINTTWRRTVACTDRLHTTAGRALSLSLPAGESNC